MIYCDPRHSRLNPLTFAHLISVPENRSALAAVQRVAACLAGRRSRRAVNPLFLHGPPGTGKTQLVSALVEEVTRQARDLAVTVLPAGDFACASREPDSEEHGLLQAARQTDLLVVEDLQLLPARSVETLVQLFDYLLARQVQMVFTSATGPRGLEIPSRLQSRLGSGLVVGLEPLQFASRLLVLEDKAQRRQLAVRREILTWLAQHLTGGGRQLDGALTRLETLTRASRTPLDVASMAEHFRELLDGGRPTVERIMQHVGGYFQVEPDQLHSGRRSRNIMLPRQVGMYLARQLTGLSLEQIGAYFGGRDHSTVLHACRKVEQAIVSDAVLSGTIRQLQAGLV
jgi:chromosomal replication initiator protein